MERTISKEEAQSFYENLCKVYNGNKSKTSQGVASVEHIADSLEMSQAYVEEMCMAMIRYHITEKQNGRIVI